MIEIKLSKYSDFKNNVIEKSLDHFHYEKQGRTFLVAIDGPLYFTHPLQNTDKDDYDSSFLSEANKKIGSFYSREPFATKVLKDGSKLFRRKHGQKATIPKGEELEVVFECPYAKAKINKLEIIDANALDRIDLLVKSPVNPELAAAYGMPPDYVLNQFGFDVVVSDLLYSDKSDYDAEIYGGFQIIARYKNDSDADKAVGFNVIFHELK